MRRSSQAHTEGIDWHKALRLEDGTRRAQQSQPTQQRAIARAGMVKQCVGRTDAGLADNGALVMLARQRVAKNRTFLCTAGPPGRSSSSCSRCSGRKLSAWAL